MDFHQPIRNFKFINFPTIVITTFLLNPLPFLFIDRLVPAEHFSIAEYSASYLVVFFIAFLEGFRFSIQDTALHREEATLSVVFKAVSLAFKDRLSWLFAERVANESFKANLKKFNGIRFDERCELKLVNLHQEVLCPS